MGFSLDVNYRIDNTWPTGYQVAVTITNNTNTGTTSWSSHFDLPPNQNVSSSWNCVMSNNTATNPTWIGGNIIPPNSSTTYGFIVNNPQNGPNQLLNLIAPANGTSPAAPV